jgi:hypothetical protein
MSGVSRRQFIRGVGAAATASLVGPQVGLKPPLARAQEPAHHVYVVRNGTPVTNVQCVVALAGGIESFVDYDDVVVLKPNGQWKNQGYTHTQCLKALIDVILARPGGFGGEVIIAEHVHRDPATALSGNYCWNMSTSNRLNNWPDMNYLELVADYTARGHPNVTADPLYDVGQSPDWEAVAGPGDLSAGKQGWVRTTYTTAANGRTTRLSHAILRSSYSDKLIDLGRNGGVWEGGGYNGQQVKLIFLPTLNNHGWGVSDEDYAGPTSAVKCHLGVVEFAGSGGYNLHSVGYDSGDPDAVGESIGHLITEILSPVFYLTCAEYTGYISRTDATAAHTRTVGLCADPVTLDYWMCKHVVQPIADQAFMNADNDGSLRQTLLGCNGKGVGTLDEAEIAVHQVDLDLQHKIFLPQVARGSGGR